MTTKTTRVPPRNWPAFLMFTTTLLIAVTLVPLYALTHGYAIAAWLAFALLLCATELSITCGYHRLFSHATYRGHPVLKALYLVFGAMALQNSALNWCGGHRAHHRFIDEPERDPYCARRGFWFSHIGWMLHDYPSGSPDLAYVNELIKDRLVALQHRHYLLLAVGTNIGLPIALGWVFDDIVGMALLAGVLRLVLTHHLTFCINSLAHMYGTRPYAPASTARDNAVMALLTFGEGYHNFHHTFSHDYRNGVYWWQWDPSKWLIATLLWAGLATNLKRTPEFKIRRARVETLLHDAQTALAREEDSPRTSLLRQRLAQEYERLANAVTAWTALQHDSMVQARRHLLRDASPLKRSVKALEAGLIEQTARLKSIVLQGQSCGKIAEVMGS